MEIEGQLKADAICNAAKKLVIAKKVGAWQGYGDRLLTEYTRRLAR